MGTSYSIKYVSDSSTPSPKKLQQEIDRELELVNDRMSTYRSGSELSRFNQSRAVSTPFRVSADTAKVVREAIRINRLTDGALDVTVGPLVNLWGFGPEGRPDVVPTEAEIAKRRVWVGIDKLAVENGALIKRIPDLYVPLLRRGMGLMLWLNTWKRKISPTIWLISAVKCGRAVIMVTISLGALR